MKKKSKSVWLAMLLFAAGVRLAAIENATLFRVFLNDGTAVVSYGEFARVADRVVFSMPIGASGDVSSAASAAAGSMMLLVKARGDLEAAVTLPHVR